MLINWQPVLGRGTSKTASLPEKEQVAGQRLNMLLWLQLEIDVCPQAFFFLRPCEFAHYNHHAGLDIVFHGLRMSIFISC